MALLFSTHVRESFRWLWDRSCKVDSLLPTGEWLAKLTNKILRCILSRTIFEEPKKWSISCHMGISYLKAQFNSSCTFLLALQAVAMFLINNTVYRGLGMREMEYELESSSVIKHFLVLLFTI